MTDLIVNPQSREHQTETVELAVSNGFWALFHEMGTGKTFTTVSIIRNLFKKYRSPLKTLILCPQVVVDNWQSEIEKWSKCGQYVQTLTGSIKNRRKILDESDKKIFITNFESLSRAGLFWEDIPTKKKTVKKKKRILDHGFDILIIDESHRLMKYNGEWTKAVIKMSDKIAHRFLLTGSPTPNSPMEIWSQYRILDRGETFGTNFFKDFRSKFWVDKNIGMPSQKHFPDWQLRIGAEAAIAAKIKKYSNSVLKEDCLDLPPLVMSQIQTTMGKDQRQAYNDMARTFIAYLEDNKELSPAVADLALTKILRLNQILSGFVRNDEGDDFRFKDVPRLKTLSDLLADINHQTIVWCKFLANYEDIASVCEKLKISYCFLTGKQNGKQKTENVRAFTAGEKQVIISNPAAGGTGVNLTVAQTSIWYGRSHSSLERQQGLARNHRGGSEIYKKINSIDIIVPNTLDTEILACLENKENMAKRLIHLKNNLKNHLLEG